MQVVAEMWEKPCFPIGAASEMVALHPQTLRRYEVLGLLVPARRAGRRLYSPRDIEHLRTISRLSTDLGLNLAGVEVIMRLNDRIQELQSEVDDLHTMKADLESQLAVLEERMRQVIA